MKEIGCFVSSHGFGHATRMAAVLEALARRTRISPVIVATTGEHIYRQTLSDFLYLEQRTDIGFCQHDSFRIDYEATVRQLNDLLPYDPELIDSLAERFNGCSCIICDISAMGIAVAARAGIPSVLVENFTWDWLYAEHRQAYPDLAAHADYLAELYGRADIHVQTEPICRPLQADLHCRPIFRRLHADPRMVRKRLLIGMEKKIVLITLGGISFDASFITDLQRRRDHFFLIAGQERRLRPAENVMWLERECDIYHPDLIGAVDLVIFKSGYSTLAECLQTGSPAVCIGRDGFAESDVIADYARTHLHAHILSQEEFISGRWLEDLDVIGTTAAPPQSVNGADQVAELLQNRGIAV